MSAKKICIYLSEDESALIDEIRKLLVKQDPGNAWLSREAIAGGAMKTELNDWAHDLRRLVRRRAANGAAS
jgi:hypothetical protein